MLYLLSLDLDEISLDGNFLPTFKNPIVGAGLVRVSVVPVAAAICLFGTGLAGFIGFSKRMKAIL